MFELLMLLGFLFAGLAHFFPSAREREAGSPHKARPRTRRDGSGCEAAQPASPSSQRKGLWEAEKTLGSRIRLC